MEYLKTKASIAVNKVEGALGLPSKEETSKSAYETAILDKPMWLPTDKFETDHRILAENDKIVVNSIYKADPSGLMMKACVWEGKSSVSCLEVPKPAITNPGDAIVKITSMTICGSDLHMYFNSIPGPNGVMQKGDILGHEACGFIDEVGPSVTKFKKGDRVSISAAICCGDCTFCKNGKWSLCDRTNPSLEMEKLYGFRTAALFGYTHLTGGFAGLMAEYARVPIADLNLMSLPTDTSVPDDIAPMLSDTALTGYWATECCKVQRGESAVVFGCGPIGLMAIYSAIFKGANPVIAIDDDENRLLLAQKIGAIPLNYTKLPSGRTVENEITENYCKLGPDCIIDATGFRFPKKGTTLHDISTTLGLSTDTVDNVAEAIHMCKKGGKIALIGDYFGTCNGFPIGALMEKALTISGGQIFVHEYREKIRDWIIQKRFNPAFLISHRFPLEQIDTAFDLFAHHKDNAVKIVVYTAFGKALGANLGISDVAAVTKPPEFGGAWKDSESTSVTTENKPRQVEKQTTNL